MAYAPDSSLSHTSNTNLRDSQTASQLFVSDQFRLAPKFDFLFHVSFGINSNALGNATLTQRHKDEIDMLVKECDLPTFEIATETVNQYNRKKVIQTKINYQPITIKFHDDNMGIVNQLWQNYFNYYYADPSSAKDAGAYARNAMKNFNYFTDTYGLNNGSTDPFFTYIKIYQLARHEYVCYTLINPIVTGWNHNHLNYFSNAVHDNNMSIAYEAVTYDTGVIGNQSPIGFAENHYDLTPSPIQGSANTTATPSFTSSNSAPNSASQLNNVNSSVNTYQNTQSILPTGVLSGIINNVTGATTQSVGGLQGVAFPTAQVTNNSTTATAVNLGS